MMNSFDPSTALPWSLMRGTWDSVPAFLCSWMRGSAGSFSVSRKKNGYSAQITAPAKCEMVYNCVIGSGPG